MRIIVVLSIIFISTIARLFFYDVPAIMAIDSFGYKNFAIEFRETSPFSVVSIRTMGYPYFIYMIFEISKTDALFNIVIAQKFIGVFMSILIAIIAWIKTKNYIVAFFGGVTFALNGHYLAYEHLILTHTLQVFFLIATVLCFLLYLEKGEKKWLITCGAMLFFQSIVRPSGNLWIIIFLLTICFHWISWKNKIWHMLIIFLIFFMVKGAWSTATIIYGGEYQQKNILSQILIHAKAIECNYKYLIFPITQEMKERISSIAEVNENSIPNNSKEAFIYLLKLNNTYQGEKKYNQIQEMLAQISFYNIMKQPIYFICREIMDNGLGTIMSPLGIADPPAANKDHPLAIQFQFKGSDGDFFQKKIPELFAEGQYRKAFQKIWFFWCGPFGYLLMGIVVIMFSYSVYYRDIFQVFLVLNVLYFFLLNSLLGTAHERYRLEWEWAAVLGFLLVLHRVFKQLKTSDISSRYFRK